MYYQRAQRLRLPLEPPRRPRRFPQLHAQPLRRAPRALPLPHCPRVRCRLAFSVQDLESPNRRTREMNGPCWK